MTIISRYWTITRLSTTGDSKTEVLPIAQAFFHQQFAELMASSTLNHPLLQRQLLDISRSPSLDTSQSLAAQLCLRCFISGQIEQVCRQFAQQFGTYYGFTHQDLFAIVLDDDGKLDPRPYQPLSIQILHRFDPALGSLDRWITHLVRQHRELNQFLLEQGLLLLSDWAILNDTKPQALQRILTEFHHLTEIEVQQASQLLDRYHAVYRRDRLQQGQTRACPLPTIAQLQEMAAGRSASSPAHLLTRLQALATLLRQYRIATRTGKLPSQSIDQPNAADKIEQITYEESDPTTAVAIQMQFLRTYRQQFLTCLKTAIAQTIRDRQQRLKPPKDQLFLTALHLFYCQGLAMTAIAQQIGVSGQSAVTRLLQLKQFRADIRHGLLRSLRRVVQDSMVHVTNLDGLNQLDAQIEIALQEQVEQLLQTDQAQAQTPKGYGSCSLVADILCRYMAQHDR